MHDHSNKKYKRLIYNAFLKSNNNTKVGYLSMSNKRLSSSVYSQLHINCHKHLALIMYLRKWTNANRKKLFRNYQAYSSLYQFYVLVV